MPIPILSLILVLATTTPFIVAQDGTEVPVSLYTDIQCETPSNVTSNVSLALNVCAVTPGLGSVEMPTVPCAAGDVQIWAFHDIACVDQDFIISLGGQCYGQAAAGHFGAIMLNCDADSPGTAAATTTIDLGVAMAATATSSVTPSSSSSLDSSNSTDSTNSSGWDSWSLGARVGVIIAGIFVALLTAFGIWDRVRRSNQPVSVATQPTQVTHFTYSETQVQRQGYYN